MLRTFVLASVGAVDLTEEKLRAILEELVARGRITAGDAERLTVLRAAAGTRPPDDWDERIRIAVEDALGRQNVASHASVQELEARVAALERASAPPPDTVTR